MSHIVTIGLVSDTHGWLDPELAIAFAGASHIIHAGDVGHQDVMDDMAKIAPTTAVRGNIDGGPLRFLPLEATLRVGALTIAALHIAGSPKRPNRDARDLLMRLRPDIIVVGHSHIPVVARVGDALWINPGAAGRQGFHTERLAARLHVDLRDNSYTLDRVVLGPRATLLATPSSAPQDP